MRSSWIRVGPKSSDNSLYKKREERMTGKKNSHVKMEAEIGVTQPQAKKYVEPSEAERDTEGFSQSLWRKH